VDRTRSHSKSDHCHYEWPAKSKSAAARRFELQQTSAATSFYTALAGKKLVRFQEFAALYPEAVFVFVGDNGQVTKPSSLAKSSRLHVPPLPKLPSDSRPG
jgi:hypothetical protein